MAGERNGQIRAISAWRPGLPAGSPRGPAPSAAACDMASARWIRRPADSQRHRLKLHCHQREKSPYGELDRAGAVAKRPKRLTRMDRPAERTHGCYRR